MEGAAGSSRRPLQAPGGPWRPRPLRPLEAPWRLEASAGPSFSWKEQEDDLFDVGIEGVALNPNRK